MDGVPRMNGGHDAQTAATIDYLIAKVAHILKWFERYRKDAE